MLNPLPKISEAKMKNFINKSCYFLVLITLFTFTNIYSQNNNNSYVFNGESSQLYILDGQSITADANQNGFGYFNSNASNKQITVQAWIYLIGDTPAGTEIPIVYRTVNNGKTFSIYLKNNKAYFSIGNNNTATLNTGELPAFQWLAITGSYDGSTLKIYSGGTLASSATFNITTGYTVTNGSTGLFVGKSNTGTFRGLIDEIRIFDIALGDNNINNSGGNGNPAENFPSSLNPYLRGQWSFTEFSYYGGIKALNDLSTYKNHLRVNNINEIVNSKHLPFFVINSAGDAPDQLPGDGKATDSTGAVTLRSAIQEANALPGFQKIYFYLPGNGPYKIQPLSTLPAITETLSLNASFQKGYVGLPIIELNGSLATGTNVDGLSIICGGITIRDFVINSFGGYGLSLTSGSGNTIQNNYFGTDLTGNSSLPNTNGGIFIGGGSSSNIIGGMSPSEKNIILGNISGIVVDNSSGNSISGNNIGLNLDGQVISNTGNGITLSGGANNNSIDANFIGGWNNSGIFIRDAATINNTVSNNHIG